VSLRSGRKSSDTLNLKPGTGTKARRSLTTGKGPNIHVARKLAGKFADQLENTDEGVRPFTFSTWTGSRTIPLEGATAPLQAARPPD